MSAGGKVAMSFAEKGDHAQMVIMSREGDHECREGNHELQNSADAEKGDHDAFLSHECREGDMSAAEGDT